MPVNQAHALTSSTFKEKELLDRLQKILTPAGLKELQEQIEQDPQRTAVYIQNLKIGAENLASINAYKNQTPYGVKRGTETLAVLYANALDPNLGANSGRSNASEQLSKKAIPALISLLEKAEAKLTNERKSSTEVRRTKNVLEDTPTLNAPQRTRSIPTYNSDLGNIEKNAFQEQQKYLRDQLQKELAARGTISDKLVQAYLANARSMDAIDRKSVV